MKQTFKFTMGRVAGITGVEQASDQNLVPPPPKHVTGKKLWPFRKQIISNVPARNTKRYYFWYNNSNLGDQSWSYEALEAQDEVLFLEHKNTFFTGLRPIIFQFLKKS